VEFNPHVPKVRNFMMKILFYKSLSNWWQSVDKSSSCHNLGQNGIGLLHSNTHCSPERGY
jgi:hypothetical protein